MDKKHNSNDDDNGDITTDPKLSEIDSDLNSISKRLDNRLLIAIFIFLPFAVIYENSSIKSPWLDFLGVTIIFGIIGYTIYSNIKQKQNVAKKYNLICTSCGYKPKVHMMLSAAMTEKCSKCGKLLDC